MNKLILATLTHVQALTQMLQTFWNLLIVFGTIQGFFTNLYNDLTVFALAMATFFFGWSALLMMTSGDHPTNRDQAKTKLYYALSGLALAILAQTVAGLVNTAATGQ